MLNAPDYPKGRLGATLFAWDDNLERVLETTGPSWSKKLEEVRGELDDRKTKRPALYRLAAMRCEDLNGSELNTVVNLALSLVQR